MAEFDTLTKVGNLANKTFIVGIECQASHEFIARSL